MPPRNMKTATVQAPAALNGRVAKPDTADEWKVELKKAGKRRARRGQIAVVIGAPVAFARATDPGNIAAELFNRVASL